VYKVSDSEADSGSDAADSDSDNAPVAKTASRKRAAPAATPAGAASPRAGASRTPARPRLALSSSESDDDAGGRIGARGSQKEHAATIAATAATHPVAKPAAAKGTTARARRASDADAPASTIAATAATKRPDAGKKAAAETIVLNDSDGSDADAAPSVRRSLLAY
jgi:hypothetical protein